MVTEGGTKLLVAFDNVCITLNIHKSHCPLCINKTKKKKDAMLSSWNLELFCQHLF